MLALTLECFPGICGLDSYGDFGLRPDTGTSMAAAHTSAVAALIIASRVAGRDPKPAQLITRLLCTARPATPKRFFRAGQLDALRAVQARKSCKRPSRRLSAARRRSHPGLNRPPPPTCDPPPWDAW